MRSRYISSTLAVLLAASVVACTSSKTNSNASQRDSAPTQPASASNSGSATPSAEQALPETKLATMSVEGERRQVELALFNQKSLPFVTYIAANDFSTEAIASDEGEGAIFYFKSGSASATNAYVKILIPAKADDVSQVQELLLGEQGWFVRNNWKMLDRTEVVSYLWAREKIVFQQETTDGLFTGSAFIGEQDGQVFYAITYYPAEYGDGFEPRASLILENLSFKD